MNLNYTSDAFNPYSRVFLHHQPQFGIFPFIQFEAHLRNLTLKVASCEQPEANMSQLNLKFPFGNVHQILLSLPSSSATAET